MNGGTTLDGTTRNPQRNPIDKTAPPARSEESTNVMPESYEVVASGELIGAFVVAMLRTVLPRRAGIDIRVTAGSPAQHGAEIRNTITGKWLFLSANARPDSSMADALEGGASAVLSCNSTRSDFEAAIQALGANGSTFVPSEVVAWLVSQSRHGDAPSRPEANIQLTGRELEVLRLVLEGQTNHEIAETLTISPNTVRSHIHSLSLKFEASNRARLVHRARMLGFDLTGPGRFLQPVREVSA
jgi:DNA-binding NarL/FixJ family response regulator